MSSSSSGYSSGLYGRVRLTRIVPRVKSRLNVATLCGVGPTTSLWHSMRTPSPSAYMRQTPPESNRSSPRGGSYCSRNTTSSTTSGGAGSIRNGVCEPSKRHAMRGSLHRTAIVISAIRRNVSYIRSGTRRRAGRGERTLSLRLALTVLRLAVAENRFLGAKREALHHRLFVFLSSFRFVFHVVPCLRYCA